MALIAMAMPMAISMAIAMRLSAMVRRNLILNPLKISSEVIGPAKRFNVQGAQVMVTRMATFRSVTQNSHHTSNLTSAAKTKLVAAHSGRNGRVLKCGSMPIVTSVVIVSR